MNPTTRTLSLPATPCVRLLLLGLLFLFPSNPVLAVGGVVKLRTDNGPDGYYYNANGAARARYCAFYGGGEFDRRAVICGIRLRAFDQSVITPGVDDYTLSGDLRSEDSNNIGYADISPAGLMALADAASITTCSTTGAPSTYSFGGGAGIPDPLTSFVLTVPQPASNNPNEGIDFCGVLLDTSSVFTNSSRTQAYSLGDNPLHATLGFNHFVEAIVFEPQLFDLNLRVTGSSRFPGDRGLSVMFARRACNPESSDCLVRPADRPLSTTDDFITARITIDNITSTPRTFELSLDADRSVINPRQGPVDVTGLFRVCGGGPRIMNPIALAPFTRLNFCVEVRTILGRGLFDPPRPGRPGGLPANIPFVGRLLDPNDPCEPVDEERTFLGVRTAVGQYDNNRHNGGFFFSRSPVVTGDGLLVRHDALDLQARSSDPPPFSVTGIQIVGGEFGSTGLPGLDAAELRIEDPVIAASPDLSPSGLRGSVSQVGDPGNADGIRFGPPATTVTLDLTDLVITPGDFATAQNLFVLAYLNPGDSGHPAPAVTAIGSNRSGGTFLPGLPFIGNSSTMFGGQLPLVPFTENDLEMRLDINGELSAGSGLRTGGRSGRLSERVPVRAHGRYIALDGEGNPIE